MNYWLDLFTAKSWDEFLRAGATVSGFREGRWATVQRLRPGDRLLCYVTGISRFIGVLEVTSDAYQDSAPIWSEAVFPSRVRVKVLVALNLENGIPVMSLRNELSFFQNLKSPNAWTGRFRGSPALWKESDGEVIYRTLLREKESPTNRPYDEKKLGGGLKAMQSKLGSVVVPEPESDTAMTSNRKENTEHERVQMSLAKLGADMGLDVWVARNDRNRVVGAYSFADMPKVLSTLPIHFDPVTTKVIEHIDLLWLKGKSIVAAFEIESTTSIYSGLLRMSDLVAMQPNINIPLYIVSSEDRREKVRAEILRPTFARMEPPMSEMCKFLPIEIFRDRLEKVGQFVTYLKPEFIDEIAEVIELNEGESDSESL